MDVRRLLRRDAGTGAAKGAGNPDFVFVVAYGRSGSTLVQGLLNSVPGVLVRGENHFFVLPLFHAWKRIDEFHRLYAKNSRRGASSAFYGMDEMKPAHFVASARELTRRELYGSADRRAVTTLGYKEVLWHEVEPEETVEFFAYFERLFPAAKYVLNRRDHDQVSSSGFWQTREPDRVKRALLRTEEIQDFLQESRPERTHRTQYERITSTDPAVVDAELKGLAEFVQGGCDDATLAAMRATLTQGHGPRPFGRSRVASDAEQVRDDVGAP